MLCHHTQLSDITLEYLEGVAKVRFALSIVAEVFNQKNKDSALTIQLFNQTREICTDPNLNTVDITGHMDTVGPVVYLIKLLVRQYLSLIHI